MNEENSNKETNVKATIDAVTGLAKAIPVYDDAIQPAAKEVGKSLVTVAKTVNIALSPIKAMVWGYERIENFITKRVSEKLKNVPEENIVTPNPSIAGPAVEALRYVGHDENLRELYANLLASSMNKDTLEEAHPSYVDIIKNLCSDEALLLKAFIKEITYPIVDIKLNSKSEKRIYKIVLRNFSVFTENLGLRSEEMTLSYIDNLCRLGILKTRTTEYLSDLETYKEIENHKEIEKLKKETEEDYELEIVKGIIEITNFGGNFIKNVVDEKY